MHVALLNEITLTETLHMKYSSYFGTSLEVCKAGRKCTFFFGFVCFSDLGVEIMNASFFQISGKCLWLYLINN